MDEIETRAPAETGEPRRPDAGELLEGSQPSACSQAKAWLLVYLGYAPGVGKTYTMLQEGRRRKAQGTDVVIGWVETYDRPQTLEAIGGLEIVPPRAIAYRGVLMQEMDIDAIIARRPQVALVDELAHTNVPGSKHSKRYQDVFELQATGINVISTVNIQHLASLQDTVLLLTGVTVQETLPDWVIDRADDLEMIDLSPEALQKRLRRGHIYSKEQIEGALNNFFRKDNLTVLRELTLRRIAAHTEGKLEAYLRSRGLQRPRPSGETVLVCVPPSQQAQQLVRRGVHLADRLRARLVALHVTQARSGLHPETTRGYQEATRALLLARALGAEVVTVAAADVAAALVKHAGELHATQIIMGESRRSWLRELLQGSVIRDVLHRTKDVDVYIARRGDG